MNGEADNRVLVVDDNRDLHGDFRKILCPDRPAPQFDSLEQELFGEAAAPRVEPPRFDVDSAYQGQQALELLRAALRDGRPYSLAFVDMRMPPGWDGVETIARLWAEDPELHVIVCTAYSDHSWREIIEKLGPSDRLLILKKPFESTEAMQMACAFTRKWALHRQVRRNGRHQ